MINMGFKVKCPVCSQVNSHSSTVVGYRGNTIIFGQMDQQGSRRCDNDACSGDYLVTNEVIERDIWDNPVYKGVNKKASWLWF